MLVALVLTGLLSLLLVQAALRSHNTEEPMGEAKAIVGGHDLAPNVIPFNGGAKPTLLSQFTSVLDGLDRAIQIKEKDLNQEGPAALAENHLKLGRLKACEALARQARALLEDYGAGLEALSPPEATKEPEPPLDPVAWIIAGAIATYANGEEWVVDEVVGVGDERVVKAHRQEFPAMKVELPIWDFDCEFTDTGCTEEDDEEGEEEER